MAVPRTAPSHSRHVTKHRNRRLGPPKCRNSRERLCLSVCSPLGKAAHCPQGAALRRRGAFRKGGAFPHKRAAEPHPLLGGQLKSTHHSITRATSIGRVA